MYETPPQRVSNYNKYWNKSEDSINLTQHDWLFMKETEKKLKKKLVHKVKQDMIDELLQ